MKIQQRRAASRRQRVLYMLPLLFSLPGAVQAAPKPIWLVVTRPMFLKNLQPLVEHRGKDGFETIVSTKPVEEAIKNCPRSPRYLLLVGDDEPGKQNEPWYVPAKRMPKTPWVQREKGTYPTDAIYGDLNNDRFPDIPVGRLPARTEKQVETMVRKILTYEAQPPRLEDLELLIWAGSTMFGETYDRFASTVLMQAATKELPRWVEPFIISANRGAFYCCIPDHCIFVSRRLKRNPGLILLDGHGLPDSFWFGRWIFHPPRRGLVCCKSDLFLVNRDKTEPMSPMIIFACLCGRFVGEKPCMAEELIHHPGGPVGCIAASLEPNALPMLYSSQAIVRTLHQPNRLGDFWVNSLRVGYRIRNPVLEQILYISQTPLCPERDMEEIRLEHATHFQLFGDPATRMRLPYRLPCKVKSNGDGTWTWTAVKPKDADKLLVSFRPKTKILFQKPKDWTDTAAVKKVFEKTNQRFSFTQLAEISAEKNWEGTIDKPGVLRLVAVGPKRIYAAAQTIKIPASPKKTLKKR